MRMRNIFLLLGPLALLAGLVLVRTTSSGESFFRPRIWLPHQGTADDYELIWPFEGPIPGDRVTLDEARSRVPFEIPLPGYLPGEATLKEVYASGIDTPRELRQAAMVYANGIHVIIRYEEMTLSWDSWFAKHPDIFKPLEVSGHPGVGAEPGLERLCVSYAPSVEWECHDGPGLRPGTVQWQANELVIAIYSYDHPLGELLRVAESVKIR